MTGLVEKPKTLWLCEEKRKNQHRWDNGEVSRRAEGFFGSLQDFIYPPTSDYFWYRTGKLNREDMPKKWKRLIVVCLILGIAANGILAGAIASTALHLLDAFSNGTDIEGETLQVYAKSILESVFSPFGLILCGSISGATMQFIYSFGANYFHETFYTGVDGDESWKVINQILCMVLLIFIMTMIALIFTCRYGNKAQIEYAKKWALINCFSAGFFGTLFFMLDFKLRFSKIVYHFDYGAAHFLKSVFVVYVFVDGWAWVMHRLLHTKLLYKRIHKFHHTFTATFAWVAFASHPLEFALIQSGAFVVCCLTSINAFAFMLVGAFLGYHAQVQHSGVWLEGEFFWNASSKFHDDHHRLFHVNIGQDLIVWDWLAGTLRKKTRVYSEDKFVGEQDMKKAKAS